MADARRVLGCTDAEAQSKAAADDDDEPTRFRVRLDPSLIHAKASKVPAHATVRDNGSMELCLDRAHC